MGARTHLFLQEIPPPAHSRAGMAAISRRRVYGTSKRLASSRPGRDAHAGFPAGDGRGAAERQARRGEWSRGSVAGGGAVGGSFGVAGEAGAGDRSGWGHGGGGAVWRIGVLVPERERRARAGDGPERI